MVTQGQDEEMTEEETWDDTLEGIFLIPDDKEKYGQAIAKAIMKDELPKFLAITKDNDLIDDGVLLTYIVYTGEPRNVPWHC